MKRCYTVANKLRFGRLSCIQLLVSADAMQRFDGLCPSVGSVLYWSSTSGAASAKAVQSSHHHVTSPNDRRSSTYDPRRGSSDDVIEQASFLLQLSPTCPCSSSADVEASDDIMKHKSSAPAAAAAKTAAVGNVTHLHNIVML